MRVTISMVAIFIRAIITAITANGNTFIRQRICASIKTIAIGGIVIVNFRFAAVAAELSLVEV